MLKVLKSVLKKLWFLTTIIFLRLRLFHQVLLIIAIMLFFMAFEGYIGLKNIQSMQQVSQQVFDDSVRGADAVYAVRNDVNEIRAEYLAKLAKLPVNTLSNVDLDTNLSQLASFKESYRTQVEGILQEAVEVKQIIKEPATAENYEILSRHLALIDSSLTRLENMIRLTSLKSMSRGNLYTAVSRKNTIILVLMSAIISFGFSLIMTRSISRPLKQMVASTNALSSGDLSRDVQAEGSKEMRSMGNSLNSAIRGLRQLIRRVNSHAETLFNASNEMLNASNESGRSAAEVSRAMEELAKGASEQSEQINRIVINMTELAELVNTVSRDTATIVSDSRLVADTAKTGQKVAGDVAEEINDLYFSTKEVAKVIEELNLASGEISEITTLITGIAEQTSLLALNAAIEAARAGEQGKGFAVVAKETGKLAEQSKQSAQSIADLILEMRKRTSQAVQVIQKGIERVEAGRNLTVEAAGTFEEIFTALNRILGQINKVAVSARQMAEKNDYVFGAINTIAAISEESMASTEEVSATTEEQSALVQQVAALSENLAEIANELKQAVTVFIIGKSEDGFRE